MTFDSMSTTGFLSEKLRCAKMRIELTIPFALEFLTIVHFSLFKPLLAAA